MTSLPIAQARRGNTSDGQTYNYIKMIRSQRIRATRNKFWPSYTIET